MKKKFNTFLLIWLVINVVALITSYLSLRDAGQEVTFIVPWGTLWTAYIWEDLLVFSIFNILGVIIVKLIKDNRYFILLQILFFLIRAIGEIFYWFLQQFTINTPYPHNQYDWENNPICNAIFGQLSDQKYFIIYQISWQVIIVFLITGLIYVLKNWDKLKRLNE